MTELLTIGITMGLYSGFAPGPLLTLTITETLERDIAAGVKVAFAPLVTDPPIILATMVVLSRLSGFQAVLGGISLAGGAFVLYLGCRSLRMNGITIDAAEKRTGSLMKGILVNFLNPSPWLFWISVGGPIVLQAAERSRFGPFLFIGSFYILLMGSKIFLAIMTGRFKSFLTGKAYVYTMRFLGLVMCALAVILFREGLRLLGVL